MKNHKPGLALIIAIAIFTLATFARTPQMSDTCGDNSIKVVDASNKREKCINASLTLIYRAKGINLNAGANTDVTPTITGLPARYIVRRVTFENASGTPTLATIALRTASGGGGTAIVTAQALSSLNATTVYLDGTLAVTSTVLTADTLTFRNVAAAGGAMTVDATVEVTPLL